ARLAQAFGRLIRRQGDTGMFVVLSAAFPSRLLKAFPPGVPVSRLPLDEAIARVEARLSAGAGLVLERLGETAAERQEGQVQVPAPMVRAHSCRAAASALRAPYSLPR